MGTDEFHGPVFVMIVGLIVVMMFGPGHGHLHWLVLSADGSGKEKKEKRDHCRHRADKGRSMLRPYIIVPAG
jgi:hypothetical protein